jgi:WD40 repeat protein
MRRNVPPRLKLITAFLLLLCLLPLHPLSAQEPITPDNVAGLIETAHFGYGQVNDLAYSPDGELFFVMTTAGIDVYQTADFTMPPERWGEFYSSGVVFLPDETQIYIEHFNSSDLIDRETGDRIARLSGTDITLIPSLDRVLSRYSSSYQTQKSDETFPSFSSDSRPENQTIWHIRGLFFDEIRNQIIVHADLWEDGFISRVIRTYNPITHEIINEYPLSEMSDLQSDMSLDRQWLASVGWSEIMLWNLETADHYPIHGDALNSAIAFSPDSQWLAVGTFGGQIVFWDVNTREYVTDKAYQFDSVVSHIGFNPQQTQIAVMTMDGLITIRDFGTDEVIAVLDSYDAPYTYSQYSNPDPQVLYADVHDLDSLWYFYLETRLELSKACENPVDDGVFVLKDVSIPLKMACRILESSPITIYTIHPFQ